MVNDPYENDIKEIVARAMRPGIVRKVSVEQSVECPIWSDFDQIWMESDAQLRQRISDLNANTEK